jgi:hypothetical protein
MGTGANVVLARILACEDYYKTHVVFGVCIKTGVE